jgi:hypothetical protein
VGASTKAGVLASYSNTHVTLAAPGGDAQNPVVTMSLNADGTLLIPVAAMGTSMAVPMVAGFMSLAFEMYGPRFNLGNALVPFADNCTADVCGMGIVSFLGTAFAMPLPIRSAVPAYRCSSQAETTTVATSFNTTSDQWESHRVECRDPAVSAMYCITHSEWDIWDADTSAWMPGGIRVDGYWSSQWQCHLCEPGSYCSTTSTVSTACPANTYSEKAQTQCLACPAGSQCPAGVIGDCAVGFYSTGAPHTECSQCLANEHHTSDRTACVTTPTTCAAGWWCSGHYFQMCPPGTWSSAADVTCTTCAPGKYSPVGSTSVDACLACPVGASCVGGEDFQECWFGYFQPETGQTTCTLCAPGLSSRGPYCIPLLLC